MSSGARYDGRRIAIRFQQIAHAAGALVTLPVYYAAESGADLEALAARAGLSPDEVIALHSGREYRVYAIGFAPGFAYLGEVDARIAAPRLATPRAKVPRGAVAIAGPRPGVWGAPVQLGAPTRELRPIRPFTEAELRGSLHITKLGHVKKIMKGVGALASAARHPTVAALPDSPSPSNQGRSCITS